MLEIGNSTYVLIFQSDIFRTIDGKCNNLKNPLWGSKTVSMRRILPSIKDLYKTDQYFSLALGNIASFDNNELFAILKIT